MGIGISAKFSKNDDLYNGLNAIAAELHDSPSEVRTAVVTYRTKFSRVDFENGGRESLTVKILEIEPLFGDAAVDAKRMQKEAFSKRTGNAMQDDLFSSMNDDDEDQDDEGDED